MQDQALARTLVENAQLPSASPYATLNQYIHEKAIEPRWEFERAQDGVYNVTLSWYSHTGSSVYAFEANTQAQTVRGINTAAIKLLSRKGFAPPASAPAERPAPAPSRRKKILPIFFRLGRLGQPIGRPSKAAILPKRCTGTLFSQRKKAEMAKGGT